MHNQVFERSITYIKLYVTDKRDSSAIFNDVLESLVEFLHQSCSVDDDIISILTPFVNFDREHFDMRAIHSIIGSDLDPSELLLEFNELTTSLVFTRLKLKKFKRLLQLTMTPTQMF